MSHAILRIRDSFCCLFCVCSKANLSLFFKSKSLERGNEKQLVLNWMVLGSSSPTKVGVCMKFVSAGIKELNTQLQVCFSPSIQQIHTYIHKQMTYWSIGGTPFAPAGRAWVSSLPAVPESGAFAEKLV